MPVPWKRNRRPVAPQAGAFDRIGGAPAVKAVVEQLYELILNDEQLAGFFLADDGSEKVDMRRLKQHMAALIAKVLDGPDGYTGRDLGAAHHGLGITTGHFQLVVDYLQAAMLIRHVPGDVVDHVMATVTSLRDQIVEARAAA